MEILLSCALGWIWLGHSRAQAYARGQGALAPGRGQMGCIGRASDVRAQPGWGPAPERRGYKLHTATLPALPCSPAARPLLGGGASMLRHHGAMWHRRRVGSQFSPHHATAPGASRRRPAATRPGPASAATWATSATTSARPGPPTAPRRWSASWSTRTRQRRRWPRPAGRKSSASRPRAGHGQRPPARGHRWPAPFRAPASIQRLRRASRRALTPSRRMKSARLMSWWAGAGRRRRCYAAARVVFVQRPIQFRGGGRRVARTNERI